MAGDRPKTDLVGQPPSGTIGSMTRQATVPSLTDEQMARRLEEAQQDERDGRLVRCHDEAELREFFRTLHQ